MTTKEDLRAMLEASLRELETLLDRLTPDEWATATATADRWTVRDTVSHLVTGEAGNLAIARGLAAGLEMYRPDFDLARYNRRNIEKNAERTPEQLRDDLRAVRRQTLEFLDGLREADLQRAGRRTTGEETTVAEVFQRIADHQREHAAEIRAAIGR
jgi:uncharacterized protein (TIGR03083 family)